MRKLHKLTVPPHRQNRKKHLVLLHFGGGLRPTKFINTQIFGIHAFSVVLVATLFVNTQSFGSHVILSENNLLITHFTNAQTFGSHKLSAELAATSFTNNQAFGNHTLSIELIATSFINQQVFGNHALNANLQANKFINEQTFNNPSVSVELTTSSFTNIQTFGTHEITIVELIRPTHFANIQVFGAPALSVIIAPQSFTNLQASGTHFLSVRLDATSFVNGQVFGSHTIAEPAPNISPTHFTNTQAFGTHALSVNLVHTSFVNIQTFGNHILNTKLEPTSFVNTQTFGAPAVSANLIVALFTNTQIFGTHALSVILEPTKFINAQASGTHIITVPSNDIVTVGIGSATIAGGTATEEKTLPGSVQAGDTVIVNFTSDASIDPGGNGGGVLGQGYVDIVAGSSASIPGRQVAYKKALAEGETTIVVEQRATLGSVMAMLVLRGVDQTTPLDVTPPAEATGGSGNPNPPSITPVTNKCAIVICGELDDDAVGASGGAPPNYTGTFVARDTELGDDNATVFLAVRILETAALEDPGAFTSTGGNDQWAASTIAFRPAA